MVISILALLVPFVIFFLPGLLTSRTTLKLINTKGHISPNADVYDSATGELLGKTSPQGLFPVADAALPRMIEFRCTSGEGAFCYVTPQEQVLVVKLGQDDRAPPNTGSAEQILKGEEADGTDSATGIANPRPPSVIQPSGEERS